VLGPYREQAPRFAYPRISIAAAVTALGSSTLMPNGVLRTISGATDSMINPGSNPTALSKSSGGYVAIGIII